MSRIEESIRQAIRAETRSRNVICKAAGVDPAQLSRFMAGNCRIGLEVAASLLAVLDLELVIKPRSGKGKRKSKGA